MIKNDATTKMQPQNRLNPWEMGKKCNATTGK